MKNDWQQVGVVGVDAGLIWVGDPCYCVTPDAKNHPAKDWSEFCDKLFEDGENSVAKQWDYSLGRPGLGVSISSGYGDGEYPVFIRKNEEGRVTEVKIVFID